jgi:lactoylglutathione lyase
VRHRFPDAATDNEAALPAFHFLARIADGGVASTLQVCVQPPYRARSPEINLNAIQSESRGDEMNFKKLTPNLVVSNVEASLKFYRTVLGFQTGFTVPNQPPYVFGSVTSGGVEIFFNDQKMVAEEYPALGAKPIGGSLTLFIEVDGIEEILTAVQKSGSKITMPLKEQFYGMREFAFEDPEGWVVTIAERIKK